VTLPNITCDNCTLQVIQVMEDDQFHGPYDVTPGVGVADVYHQCIDLVLSGPPVPKKQGCDAAFAPWSALILLIGLWRSSLGRRSASR
jgi:hypothetical protein